MKDTRILLLVTCAFAVLLGAWLLSSSALRESVQRDNINLQLALGVEGNSSTVSTEEVQHIRELAFALIANRNTSAARYEFYAMIAAWVSFALMGSVTVLTALVNMNSSFHSGPAESNPEQQPTNELSGANTELNKAPIHINQNTPKARQESHRPNKYKGMRFVVPLIAAAATVSSGLSERLDAHVDTMDQATVSFRSELEMAMQDVYSATPQEAQFILGDLKALIKRME